MCGLVFAISTLPVKDFILAAHIRQNHRGRDAEGIYLVKVGNIHLGMAHERLAIVDLSKDGNQPMLSASGRMRIIFNGEIYNYRELAVQFGLKHLRSNSDTEIVVELIELLGIDEACRLFNGMWVIIIQDCETNKIYLSRDRFGKKPLYFHSNKMGIYFASEMHSLVGLFGQSIKPDPVVAARFLTQSLQNIDERSWIKGISVFPSASNGEIDIANPEAGIQLIRRYWAPQLDQTIQDRTDADIIEELGALVKDSMNLRLHADVPVGVALSGGIDSSIIATLAARACSSPSGSTVLFSVVSPGSPQDESEHIDTMERHLKLDVHRFRLDPYEGDGLLALLKRCTRHNDGPLSSFSNVLFYKLMERSRDAGIKVVLTGQGADEIFCGYRKYPFLEIKRRLQSYNFGGAIALASGFLFNGTLLPEFNLREAKRYMGATNRSLLGANAQSALQLESLSLITTLADRQWKDISKYSVPYLCHYEDRMSMAWSREVRSPFLDYRIVDLGLKMPERLKLHRGWTKYALRQAFAKDLPSSIVFRKDKKGFVNPQDDWLRGTLRPEVSNIMSNKDSLVYEHGLVDRSVYLELFDSYCDGNDNIWFRDVFAPFALELWLREVTDIVARMKS
jgi:asparagine synthase (glutamine-hydrolysing)